jgi:phage anti-repressor protein
MTRLSFVFLLLPLYTCFGQNLNGEKYYNHFDDSITLIDTIYFHKVKFDNFSNTYLGVFKRIKDTLFFNQRMDFGALRRNNSSFSNKKMKDSIINIAIKKEALLIEKYEWRFIASLKMLIKDNKLYLLNSNGELDLREFMKDGKKYRNYFTKTE